MRVLIISTYDRRGGAAIATTRLMHALKSAGHDVSMAVRTRYSNDPSVFPVGGRMGNQVRFYWERGVIYLHNRLSKRHLFDVSIANTGISVTDLPEFQSADVIHLHWINQGMLSLDEIGRIVASGKKVVWTMHDMWPFTGICHYAGTCEKYEQGCGSCPFLISSSEKDLSHQVFLKKQINYSKGHITFISVSNWLCNLAKKSPLLKGHNFRVIPNVINTREFSPQNSKNKTLSRLINGRKVIIMGAARLDHKIKGFPYLKLALEKLIADYQVKRDDLFLFLFGKVKYPESFFADIPISYHFFDEISDVKKIAQLYNHSDVVVIPSLYETFGQTITEAMSCGCPAVTFNNSGQTDIIDHKVNGYLALYENVDDFAKGIYWALFESDTKSVAINARKKILTDFSQETIAKQHLSVYNEED